LGGGLSLEVLSYRVSYSFAIKEMVVAIAMMHYVLVFWYTSSGISMNSLVDVGLTKAARVLA
jgi:hypothetical protein